MSCVQVLLRGQPNWDACLRVVDAVVNVSAPCAEQDHRPSCVLGAPQPELQGNFMGLTGVFSTVWSAVYADCLLCMQMLTGRDRDSVLTNTTSVCRWLCPYTVNVGLLAAFAMHCCLLVVLSSL